MPEIIIPPGKLRTDVHKSAVGAEGAQIVLNCNTDKAAFQIDRRFRTIQPAPDSGAQALIFGLSAQAKILAAVHGEELRTVAASIVGTSDGDVDEWIDGVLNGSGIGDHEFRCWQHAKWLFFTHPDGNVRYLEIGQNVLETLYRNYSLDTNSVISIERPPYTAREFTGDTVAAGTGSWHEGGDVIITDGGVRMYDPWDPTGYRVTRHSAVVTFAAPVDWSRCDYLMFNINTLAGNFLNDSVPVVRLFNATRPTFPDGFVTSVKWKKINGGQAVVWVDLTGIDRTERSAITKISFYQELYRDGSDGWFISALRQGGVFLNSLNGTKIDSEKASTAKEVQYAYAYVLADGTNLSPGTIVVLPGYDALGLRDDGDLPYGGIWAKLTLSVNGDPPYGATSKIRVYRKVEDTWYRIDDNSILNTGTPTWTDKRTADEVKLLSTADGLTFGDLDPSASGAVTKIECGCSWGGANVYFGSGGEVFFSQVENFKNVLWNEITIDNNPDEDAGRPRTMTADPFFKEPVIACVARDALYMFTRHFGFAVTGDIPSEASFPRMIPGSRGVLGPRAACGWEGGVLVASDDGVWAIEVPSAYSGGQYPRYENLARSVLPDYLAMIEDDPEATVVAADDEEAWIFNGFKYLHLTKEGSWIVGEWMEDATVVAAASSSEHGIALLLEDGRIGLIGDFVTDGGTDLEGSNGVEPEWVYRSGRIIRENIPLRVRCAVEYVGRPNVEVSILTERAPNGVKMQANEISPRTFYDLPFPGHENAGGGWVEVEVRGKSSDVVYHLEVEIGDARAR